EVAEQAGDAVELLGRRDDVEPEGAGLVGERLPELLGGQVAGEAAVVGAEEGADHEGHREWESAGGPRARRTVIVAGPAARGPPCPGRFSLLSLPGRSRIPSICTGLARLARDPPAHAPARAMNTTPVSLLEQLRQPDDQGAWERFARLYTPL